MRERHAATTCLAIEGLTKRFGGFYALNDLAHGGDATGHIHALIGPNGAGKTTFFNLVTGVLPADPRPDRLRRRADVDDARPSQRTLKGIARTFQNIRLFPHLDRAGNRHDRRALPRLSTRCGRRFAHAVLQLPFREASEERRMRASAIELLGIPRARRPARRQGLRPALWRPAPARDGARARHPAASCCCSTSRPPA